LRIVKGIVVSFFAGLVGSWAGQALFEMELPFPSVTTLYTIAGAFCVLSTGYAGIQLGRSRAKSYLLLLPIAMTMGVMMMLPWSLSSVGIRWGLGFAFLTYVAWVVAHASWTAIAALQQRILVDV
jgi:hypothetical protein